MKMTAVARRRGRPMKLLFFASAVSVVGLRNSGAAALTQLKLLSHFSPPGGTSTKATAVAGGGGARARLPYGVPRASSHHPRPSSTVKGRRSIVLAAKSSSSSASSSASASSIAPEEIVTVSGETETEETIKKSRFIGRCGPAATFEEGKALLARVLKEHPKARHSCWAWRGLGDEHRFSDDGEPGGTAGQPILGGIESEGVSEVMVVVTRYSGGIKLGTGGLCRAYGGGSRLCLQAAERETRIPVLRLRVTAPVESVGDVYHAVSGCKRLSEEFTADGSIVLRVAVELGQAEEVRGRLQDATKGAAQIEEEDENDSSPAD